MPFYRDYGQFYRGILRRIGKFTEILGKIGAIFNFEKKKFQSLNFYRKSIQNLFVSNLSGTR
jgi:hypothetical protein